MITVTVCLFKGNSRWSPVSRAWRGCRPRYARAPTWCPAESASASTLFFRDNLPDV
jgi:hypothetical protein